MSNFAEGSIIQWVSVPENNDIPGSEIHLKVTQERILHFIDEDVVVIQLEGGLPFLRAKLEIADALNEGTAVKSITDPYAKCANPDNAFLNKHRHVRDRAWNIIKDIVDEKPDIYLPQKRGRLINEVVEDHKSTKAEVYKFLIRYWVSGEQLNGLLPFYDRCGAPGKSRIITSEEQSKQIESGIIPAKRGRPNKLSKINQDYKGLNVTEDIVEIFKLSIKLYYDKQQKLDLRATYDEMNRKFFNLGKRIEKGVEVKIMAPSHELPTFGQFRYWYEKLQDYDKSSRKRLGENRYNLELRAITGDSTKSAFGPGSLYMIDATIADIYLVSLLCAYRVIGRPVVYFVKDVFSRMIVGFYVGLESPSWTAAMMAIANVTKDKVELCAEYGIEIEEHEWPCHHLCEKFVGDGGELLSINSDALVERLKIPVANCSPYRGDLKAIVERQFGIANNEVVKWMPGAVHDHEVERRNNPLDAIMNIHEFIRAIIIMILEHNQCKWLDYYRLDRDQMADDVDPIPIKLWNWGIISRSGALREKTQDVVKLALMPRAKAVITERGIRFKRMYYSCDSALREQWFARARGKGRWEVEVSYDTRKADVIYLLNKDGGFEPCKLVDADARFKGASLEEVEDFFERQDIKYRLHETTGLQSAARRHGMLDAEIKKAKARKKEAVHPGTSNSKRKKEIPENREVEKQQARAKEAFDLRIPVQRSTKPGTVHKLPVEHKDGNKNQTSDQQKKGLLDMLVKMEEKNK